MIEGSLIHCLLLKPEAFDDEFILASNAVPSASQIEVLQRLFVHHDELCKENDDDTIYLSKTVEDYSTAVLDILEDINLYQSMKIHTRLKKIINDTTQEYWEFMIKSTGKKIIGHDTYDFCKAVVDKITSNPTIMSVMGFFDDDMLNFEKFNEIELVASESTYPFMLRGIVDNMVIDNDNKEIRINDLKKTGKSISEFQNAIDLYRYWLQGAFYKKLIELSYLTQPKYKDYTVVFRFLVVDPYMQIAPIRVSDDTMKIWSENLDKELLKATYHIENRNFELPYEYLVNGELVL